MQSPLGAWALRIDTAFGLWALLQCRMVDGFSQLPSPIQDCRGLPLDPSLIWGCCFFSPLQLQSYFAACEDETPAIRNHDKVLQRLCEHLDHALLYG